MMSLIRSPGPERAADANPSREEAKAQTASAATRTSGTVMVRAPGMAHGARHGARGSPDARMVDRVFVAVAQSVVVDGCVEEQVVFDPCNWALEPAEAADGGSEESPIDQMSEGTGAMEGGEAAEAVSDAWESDFEAEVEAVDSGAVDAVDAALPADSDAQAATAGVDTSDDGGAYGSIAGDTGSLARVAAVAPMTPALRAPNTKGQRGRWRDAMSSTIGVGLAATALLITVAALLRLMPWQSAASDDGGAPPPQQTAGSHR